MTRREPVQGDITRLARTLSGAERVTVISHRSPDGDTIGSGLALAAALRTLGSEVTLVCADPLPPSVSFLEGWEGYRRDLDATVPADLYVAVDCADIGQMGALGPAVRERSAAPAGADAAPPLVNLDHHRSNTRYGTINVVDADSASVAEMVYDLVGELGVPLSAASAQALLTGIINDTHAFQNSNTTARALRVAAALVDAGADASLVSYYLFRARRPEAAELWRRAFGTLSLDEDGRVASLQVTSAAVRESGADPRGDTDGMVDFLSGIVGVELAVVLKQTGPSASKASLRTSAAVDAVALAQQFGGGGHSRAAGCDIPEAPVGALAALIAAYRATRDGA